MWNSYILAMLILIHIEYASAYPKGNLKERKVNPVYIRSKSCTPTQLGIIYEELGYASHIASVASQHLTEGPYYKTFFPGSVTNRPSFKATMSARYSKMSMFPDPSTQHTLAISCDDKARSCLHAYATMRDMPGRNLSQINFCNIFFNDEKVKSTTERLNSCKSNDPQYSLAEFRNTRASIVLHELSHTLFGMDNSLSGRALDYAYGVGACLKLARGGHTLVGGRAELCPNKGLCEPEKAEYNADTIALFATGIYFSKHCGSTMPLFAKRSVSASKPSSTKNPKILASRGTPTSTLTMQTSPSRLARAPQILEYKASTTDMISMASVQITREHSQSRYANFSNPGTSRLGKDSIACEIPAEIGDI